MEWVDEWQVKGNNLFYHYDKLMLFGFENITLLPAT